MLTTSPETDFIAAQERATAFYHAFDSNLVVGLSGPPKTLAKGLASLSTQSEAKKSLLFISNVFYPDSSATSQLFFGLLRRMSSELEITVYSGFPTAARGDSTKVPKHETIDGITIVRCGSRTDHKKSLFHRAWRYFSFLMHVGAMLVLGKRFDKLLGVTNPPFVGPLLWFCSRLRKFSYDYMLLDIYPEGVIALGNLSPKSFLSSLWKLVNKWAYRASERIVVLGRDMIPLVAKGYGIPEERFVYIPHWSAVDIERPLGFKDTQLTKRLGLEKKFVIQYSGNMGLWHDMDTIVRAAELLKDRSDIHFLLIGDGRRRRQAEKLSGDLSLNNVTWHVFVPIEELRDSLSSCHMAIISLRQGLEGVAVPCKLYGILASGRAILAQVPPASEVGLTVHESDCGIVVDFAPESLADSIRIMAENRQAVEKQGHNGFAAYKNKYRVEQAEAAFRLLWGLSRD